MRQISERLCRRLISKNLVGPTEFKGVVTGAIKSPFSFEGQSYMLVPVIIQGDARNLYKICQIKSQSQRHQK